MITGSSECTLEKTTLGVISSWIRRQLLYSCTLNITNYMMLIFLLLIVLSPPVLGHEVNDTFSKIINNLDKPSVMTTDESLNLFQSLETESAICGLDCFHKPYECRCYS